MASGLAAAVALDPTSDAETNAAAMEETLQRVRTGGVTAAARDDSDARFRSGDAVGFVDEQLVAWGAPADTLASVMRALADDGAELLSCIAGDSPPLEQGAVESLVPDGMEFEYSVGGQPSWWWLLAAE
jgi:dihydroxyacetone kinase-like predicted kinase